MNNSEEKIDDSDRSFGYDYGKNILSKLSTKEEEDIKEENFDCVEDGKNEENKYDTNNEIKTEEKRADIQEGYNDSAETHKSLKHKSLAVAKKVGTFIKKESGKMYKEMKKAGKFIAKKSKPAAKKIKKIVTYVNEHLPEKIKANNFIENPQTLEFNTSEGNT